VVYCVFGQSADVTRKLSPVQEVSADVTIAPTNDYDLDDTAIPTIVATHDS